MVQEEPRNQVAISTHPLRSAGRRGGGGAETRRCSYRQAYALLVLVSC